MWWNVHEWEQFSEGEWKHIILKTVVESSGTNFKAERGMKVNFVIAVNLGGCEVAEEVWSLSIKYWKRSDCCRCASSKSAAFSELIPCSISGASRAGRQCGHANLCLSPEKDCTSKPSAINYSLFWMYQIWKVCRSLEFYTMLS